LLTDCMQNALNKTTPKCKANEYYRKIDDITLNLIVLQNKLHNIAQKAQCKQCKTAANRLSNKIKYNMKKINNEQLANKMKKLEIKNGSLWNAVRLSKINSKNNKKVHKIHSYNGITYDKKEIANSFADNFEKVHRLTINLGNTSTNNLIKQKYDEMMNSEINEIPSKIHPYEIKEIIKKLKNEKAPGVDNINN
ncbi:hypothetical protein PV327_011541, partial [Microctonus hyperodae]